MSLFSHSKIRGPKRTHGGQHVKFFTYFSLKKRAFVSRRFAPPGFGHGLFLRLSRNAKNVEHISQTKHFTSDCTSAQRKEREGAGDGRPLVFTDVWEATFRLTMNEKENE